ncbi:hypothetical protein [Nocardiopsis algeriensis]|uniref:Uncharacterized protein n=1 Tax=Nocardiopsis algeriensis TaxID=1478215 RepID=A0A841INL8_9ACTN|nr:hypothetical protein [Nocardiopsis algeriensis]MBB6119684.1 hypothetical protein [Nocardiopsis algeriensis]
MKSWFRTYDEDEGLWRYFETDGEGWAVRQVEIREADSVPVTAASLKEVLRLRDHGGLGAMNRYERRYGVLAEGGLDGWQEQPQADGISAEEFDRLWDRARRALGPSD